MPNDTLRIENLVVSFSGFRVLDDLSLIVTPGELRFLIGPNGAGKTTLMDVISGKVKADSGRVVFGGTTDLTRMAEDAIVKRGIGRKFQTPSVFASLTCFENVQVAGGFRDGVRRLFGGLTGERRERVQWALERVGLAERALVEASALSHGERQWLEIAMLLVQDPSLLLLDEPVAGMTHQERDRTGELLHALEGQHSLIVTEHDMDFVREFSRTVTVLHQGAVLKEGSVEEIQADARVQEVYMGRAHAAAGGTK